ncbi:MAG: VOC family protein [Gammaproteobacteria bacterium]
MHFQRWHIGSVVADIATAVADYRRFGPCNASEVARLSTRKWDNHAATFVDETVEVAFLRDAGGETIELIRPITSTGPQARLLAQRPGPSHAAYWCDDPGAAAGAMLEDGAAIVHITLGTAANPEALVERGGPRALLPVAGAIYLRLPGGLVVELNRRPANLDGMAAIWGDALRQTLPEVGGAG